MCVFFPLHGAKDAGRQVPEREVCSTLERPCLRKVTTTAIWRWSLMVAVEPAGALVLLVTDQV